MPCVSHILAVRAYCVCWLEMSEMSDENSYADAESSDREVEPPTKKPKTRSRGRPKKSSTSKPSSSGLSNPPNDTASQGTKASSGSSSGIGSGQLSKIISAINASQRSVDKQLAEFSQGDTLEQRGSFRKDCQEDQKRNPQRESSRF